MNVSYVSYDFFGIMGSMPQIILLCAFTLMLVLFNCKYRCKSRLSIYYGVFQPISLCLI